MTHKTKDAPKTQSDARTLTRNDAPHRGEQAGQSEPDVPAGDSPPRPAWPLIAVAVVWCGWIAFLVVMMAVRLRTTPV